MIALIVDDDADLRALAGTALEGIGLEVREAHDGAEALRIMDDDGPPAIALIDVMMPVMDGFELVEAMRARRELAEVPILMMTGLDDLESIDRAYDVGATDFMSKPIKWVILQQRVRYMLRACSAARELAHSRRSLARAQRIAGLGSWEWSDGDAAFLCSDELLRILGLPRDAGDQPCGQFLDRVHPDDRAYVEASRCRALEVGGACDVHYRVRTETGDERFVHEVCEATSSAERRRRLTATVHDITEKRRSREQIERMASHDALTGLLNRNRFRQLGERTLASAAEAGERLWLFYVDLDRFARINDAYGHALGDEVLRQVAERLRRNVRASDAIGRVCGDAEVSAARLAGDEFCVLLHGIADPADAAIVARRLQAALRCEPEVDDGRAEVTCSLGIAAYPDDGCDMGTLMRHGRLAMERARDAGGEQVVRYQSRFGAARESATLESQLPRALARGEFELHYQPIFSIRDDAIVKAEALMRWNHPDRGPISPGIFIPLAEESGFIRELGHWALARACADQRSWAARGLAAPRVAVNVSAIQLRNGGLIDEVQTVLAATGIDPIDLEIELTESSLVEAGPAIDRLLGDLHALGIRIAIDDFGTGYSSLSYLSRLPAHCLKIDRAFLDSIEERPAQQSLVAGIIGLSHGLGLEVVAEGIERPEQLRLLASYGCDLVQGYLTGCPVPTGNLESLLLPERERRARRLPKAS